MNVEIVVVLVLAVLAVAVAAVAFAMGLRQRRSAAEASPLIPKVEVLDTKVSQIQSKLDSIQEVVTTQKAVLEKQVEGIESKVGAITQLFTDDRARGNWGEISLLRMFELGGLVEGRDYQSQFHAGDRTPDAVVNLPGGRKIVIDAKFPVARFRDALVVDDPDQRTRLLREQAREIENVGKSLIGKGYADLASGDYVVMYLPSQAVYEAAVAAAPEVVERLLERRVVVAGPAALFPLLVSVGAVLTEYRAVQQTNRILADVRELHRRIVTFVGYLEGLGTHLRRAVEAFNRAVGSWTSRLSPQLARLSETTGVEQIDDLPVVEETVRDVPVEE